MVEHQRIWCRISYLANAIFQPSKLKLLLTISVISRILSIWSVDFIRQSLFEMDQFLELFGSVAARYISSTKNWKHLHGHTPGSDTFQCLTKTTFFKFVLQACFLIGRLVSILDPGFWMDKKRHLVSLIKKSHSELSPWKFMWMLQWLSSKMEHVSIIECRHSDKNVFFYHTNISKFS